MLELHRAYASLVADLVTANSEQSVRMQMLVDRIQMLESGTLDRESRQAYYESIVEGITTGRHQVALDSLVAQLDSNMKFGPENN